MSIPAIEANIMTRFAAVPGTTDFGRVGVIEPAVLLSHPAGQQLLAQTIQHIEAPQPDPVRDLARSGTIEDTSQYLAQNPGETEAVLQAFAEERPGLVPDVIEASAAIITQTAALELEVEPSLGNRFWGALRAVGGGLEAAAGAAVVLAPDPFVVTDILGGAAVVHGADNFQAGIRQLWTGRETESGTELVAEGIAKVLGADDEAAEWIGDGVDLALGLGLGSTAAIQSLGRLAQRTGTVWDDIARSAGTTDWPGTVVPRAFELTVDAGRNGAKVWVHPNASEHIAERAAGLANRLSQRNLPTELADLGAQVQLNSLRNAVSAALENGRVPIGQTVEVGGWQLSFGAPRNAGDLPALFHALPLDYIQ